MARAGGAHRHRAKAAGARASCAWACETASRTMSGSALANIVVTPIGTPLSMASANANSSVSVSRRWASAWSSTARSSMDRSGPAAAPHDRAPRPRWRGRPSPSWTSPSAQPRHPCRDAPARHRRAAGRSTTPSTKSRCCGSTSVPLKSDAVQVPLSLPVGHRTHERVPLVLGERVIVLEHVGAESSGRELAAEK